MQGLGLGESVSLAHGQATLQATFNHQPYAFAPQAPAGAPLDLRVVAQPTGQVCAVSDAAPATVPGDGAPVFVRCRHTAAPRAAMPATAPGGALALAFGWRDIAHPGIAYESRPGLVGGLYPYEYRLQSLTLNGVAQSLAAATLDARLGTLRFTPRSEGTYLATVEVRDSSATPQLMTTTVQIESAAARFVFVAPQGVDDAARGSMAAPYRTLAYALARTTGQQAVVLRRGTYAAAGVQLIDSRAKQLLAYPDEVVTLDMAEAGNLTVRTTALPMARIEGMDVINVKQYGIVSDPSRAGLVVRNVRFVNGVEGPNRSENPGFILGWGDTSPVSRHKLLIQDNDFGRYRGAAYAFVLFDAGNSLVEENQVRLGAGVNGGFHDKDNAQNNTYRRNYLEFDAAESGNSGIHISAQANSENVHIHHNLLVNAPIVLGTQCFQSTCFMREHNVHHNTLAGGRIRQSWGVFNPSSDGTRVFHNIIASRTLPPYAGLSCSAGVPAGFATQMTTGANLIESTHRLAHKDTECTGNDMDWAAWRSTWGRDTVASGSVLSGSAVLTGSGITTGLPAGDPRRSAFGHQLP
ncbi:right-handed parallel beta-helix repeat-containing protein [Paracidovorax sp. MALMAid1276]|uniref:right-handed parallel beta-helix repeat-containing protein n=1 Tax=Paracidovorax sp. MALMAid1276 TaxID=3411631 RepID=UPI003B9CD8BC